MCTFSPDDPKTSIELNAHFLESFCYLVSNLLLLYVYICVCTYVRVYIYIYVCVCVCVCV